MGNSRWRLETALNFVAKNVQELGREADVEVLVADWGSDVPLREVLQLSPAAARIVSFVLIPGELARVLQEDSPFPEVLALNAVARRVNGQYIGRIDQDTLAGKRFLRMFFEIYEGGAQLDVPLDSALLFASRRHIPYRLAVRCPSFWTVDRFVHWFGQVLKTQHAPPSVPFYYASVGIWLVHRNLWNECGGYDERMIYMNDMEYNMISRLLQKYQMVDLGKLVDYDFYHLEHYHPRSVRKARAHRKINPDQAHVFHPNRKDWGLIQPPLDILPYYASEGRVQKATLSQRCFELPDFLLVLVSSGIQMAWDIAIKQYSIWSHRARAAWNTVRKQPLVSWPRLLMSLWVQRQSPQRRQRHN